MFHENIFFLQKTILYLLVLVPCTHLYKGQIGLKGHTVMFNKHIEDICIDLPRKRVNMICLIKEYTTTMTQEIQHQKFLIRRDKVLGALLWLKENHEGYKKIKIVKENLNWMGNSSEKYLNAESVSFLEQVENNIDTKKEFDHSESVSSEQTCESISKPIEILGMKSIQPTKTRTVDEKIRKTLEKTMKYHEDEVSPLMFPRVDDEPINEFQTNRIFADAYPWLFPSGKGDVSNTDIKGKKSAYEWAQRLLRWPDGRFMADEFFSFHLPNFLTRHENNNSGFYFVNNYIDQKDISVEELQDQILQGNTDFVKKIINFSGDKLRGSDAWWRYRRHELNSWITYHLNEGHGPPTLFMTFSCAEYWWKDMLSVLFERIQHTTDKEKVLMCQSNSTSKQSMEAKCYLVDKYTAIIQEYFQIRLDNWMETVGKKVFGITHYWLRYEFTKGRGQIHGHLLGITSDLYLLHDFYNLWENEKNKEQAAILLSEYVQERFDLSEELPETKTEIEVSNHENPISNPYNQITNNNDDKINCARSVHMHKCNKFCLRFNRNR